MSTEKYAKFIAEQFRRERGPVFLSNPLVEGRGPAYEGAHPGTHTYGNDPENASERKAERAYAHVDRVFDHAHKKGYKINHNDGQSKKAHQKPDITFHTDGGDDAPSSYTIHGGGAAHGDPKVHPGPKHHAHMYSGAPGGVTEQYRIERGLVEAKVDHSHMEEEGYIHAHTTPEGHHIYAHEDTDRGDAASYAVKHPNGKVTHHTVEHGGEPVSHRHLNSKQEWHNVDKLHPSIKKFIHKDIKNEVSGY